MAPLPTGSDASLVGSLFFFFFFFFFATAPFRERWPRPRMPAPSAAGVRLCPTTSKSSLRGAWQLTYGRRPPGLRMEPRHDVS